MRLTLLLLPSRWSARPPRSSRFPGEVFTQFPYAPDPGGQYIIKNVVLVSAGFVIGATVRGGGLSANPEAVESVREPEARRKQGFTV